jgi:2-polyprenyl-3-methyl-5-hydroxy-6-metoxy-1,4-benzoquinol methylase
LPGIPDCPVFGRQSNRYNIIAFEKALTMTKISDLSGIEISFNFISEIMGEQNPRSVLDVGCGTGSNLTIKLAKAFPDIQFLGIDTDWVSINYAKQNETENLKFIHLDDLKPESKFDIIVASEVIEHVDEPNEFLLFLRQHVSPRGKVILSLPNGYGPKEITNAIVALLIILLNSLSLKDKVKVFLQKNDGNEPPIKYTTLASSPHINFFSFKEILNIFKESGFEVVKYRPRTFLGGIGFARILKGDKILNWNASIAEKLPPQLNSTWIFVLQTTEKYNEFKYKRNYYSLIQKLINNKRLSYRKPLPPDSMGNLVC